VIGKFRTEL
jgi:hypothetical protein